MHLLLGLLLSPAHAAPRAVLALDDVEADGCGVVRGAVEIRPWFASRRVSIAWEGAAPVEIGVPRGVERVPFEVFVGPSRTAELGARWRFVDADPVWVELPGWDVTLGAAVPVEAPPAGEVPPLEVSVLGPCALDALALSVEEVATERVFAWRTRVTGAQMRVPLDLPVGVSTLRLTLTDGAELVAERELEYPVGPPCLDEDGDGALSCRHADCDDRDPRIRPGAEDVVGNGLDEDCDGRNGQDRDHDGFEDEAVGGDDCDDRQATVNPAADRFPDPDGDGASALESLDYDCDGTVNTRPGAFDCDESDPSIPRDEAPLPTGVDEDCDGLVDEGTTAFDDDGDGLAEQDGDCDDVDPRIRPGASETPDCRDEDCDGTVDEGVVRPPKDDRHEPNDVEAAEVAGAYYRSGFFGGSWKRSRTEVRAVTRDLDDVERFTVYAHDGGFDSFYVYVRAEALGDDRTYEITVVSPDGWSRTGVAAGTGDEVSVSGKGGRDDSGDYTIEVRPLSGELSWCPLELVIGTG